MKKIYGILLLILISLNVQSQCVTTVNATNSGCDSLCNGLVVITMSGSAMPYSIYIDGTGPYMATSAYTLASLCPGTYSYYVVDANGDTCTGTSFFTISAFPSLAIQLTGVNASCTICNDGMASAAITGGSGPYAFLWSNGATTGTINNLVPGIYTVSVTDANGCMATDTITIGIGNNGYYGIQGQVYLDLDADGVKDVGEPGVANQIVTMTQGPITAVSNQQGEYFFIVTPGTYDISYTALAGWLLSSSPATYTPTVSTATVTGLDFGVTADSTYMDTYISLHSNFPRCFTNVPYYFSVYNTGFTVISGDVTLTHDPNMTFVSSVIAPTSSGANYNTFSFSNLYPGQFFTNTITFTEPAGGTNISNTLTANITDNMSNSFMDTLHLNQMTACSCDPNDKSATPAGIGPLNYVANDEWMEYLIRFQNTGNDTAFTVFILDTIDSGLDLNTFSLLGSSHPVEVNINPGREMEFRFNNILLPDSIVDEPGSHGYVLYRIKGMTSNPDPTSVSNTAYIYFDFNSAVVTNTTLTTFSDNWLSIAEPSDADALFELFPNPMNDVTLLRLKSPSNIQYTITLTDIQGKVVFDSKKMVNGSLLIEKDDLKPGTYILEATPSNLEKPVHLRLVKK